MTVCNTLMAAGMAKVASLIEGGASQKEAVVEAAAGLKLEDADEEEFPDLT